jgi:hypothetical protein
MLTQLKSWNDGATKSAIVNFVEKVTTANGPDFVPPAERIPTFDKDDEPGTRILLGPV